MTVLVLAQDHDRTADQVVLKLAEREVPVFRADTSWFPQELALDAHLVAGRWTGWLRTPHREVALEALHAAWYRSPATFAFPDGMSSAERQHAHREAKLGLGGVLMSLPLLWVNHPARLANAVYKPLQLAVAARCGLEVPRTIVTNDPAAVRSFADENATGGVVVKALGTSRVAEEGVTKIGFTRRLSTMDLDDLDGIDVAPHQVQDWVEKHHEARIVVVDRMMFPVGIHAGSDASYVDWRSDHNALHYEMLDMPPCVAAGIRAFMVELGLTYGALDFVITPKGHWVFLECNPGGQFGWLEAHTGAPISTALAELLANGKERIS